MRSRVARRVGRRVARGLVAAGTGRRRVARRRRRDRVGRRQQYSLRAIVRRWRRSGREQMAFYLAVGPERDGAEATAGVLRRRGWRDLLSSTRDALQGLEQSTGHEAVDRLINRNLLFAYFYGVGRALDDAQYYLVRTSRAVERPWRHGARLGSADVDDSRRAARRPAARARAVAAHVRDARLRAGPRRSLSRRHAVRARLCARGRGELSRWRPIATFATRATTASWTSRRWPTRCTSRAEDLEARTRQARSAVLHRGEPVRRAGGVSVHAARERGGRAGARRPAPHARRGDRARSAGSRRGARGDPPALSSSRTRGQSTFASAIDLAGSTSVVDDPAASAFWLPLYETVRGRTPTTGAR